MGFDFSLPMRKQIDIVATVLAAVSLILSVFILTTAAIIWSSKRARSQLDRISFRLCLWAMAAQAVYDIAHVCIFAPTGLIHFTPGECAAGMTFRVAMLGLVNYLFTCIALNLMLTIVFGISPAELHLERWYVGVSFTLALAIPIIAASLGHFGWDPIFEACYFSSSVRNTRVRNFMTDLYLWQALSCIVAAVSVVITMVKLYKSSRTTKRIARNAISTGSEINLALHECPHSFMAQTASASSTSSSVFSRLFSKSELPCGCVSTKTSSSGGSIAMFQLQDKLKGVALKISLYPIALIVMNSIVTAGDVYTAVTHGVHSYPAYVFTFIHRALCGGRGVIFAMLCIFVDPCLYRGVRILLEERREMTAERQKSRRTNGKVDDEKSEYPANLSPKTEYMAYSPTCLPSAGTVKGLREDSLDLNAPALKAQKPPLNRSQSESTIGDRHSSESSFDFVQMLGYSPSNASSTSKGNSKPSMDFAAALRLAQDFTTAMKLKPPVKTPKLPPVSKFQGASLARTSSTASMYSTPSTSGSGRGSHGSVTGSLDMTALASGRQTTSSSLQSMDLAQALNAPPRPPRTSRPAPSVDVLGRYASRTTTPPIVWTGPYGQQSIPESPAEGQLSTDRPEHCSQENQHWGRSASLEKLYEEAESQL